MVDGALERLAPLRLLLAGGDVLSVPHVRRVLEALPGGAADQRGTAPTENTTFTCCHLMAPQDGPRRLALSVPLGRPIHGTRVVVVDRSGPRGSRGRARRAVRRRGRPRPRLPGPAGSDRGGLRARSLGGGARRAPVPDRRSRPLPAGRPPGIPRAARPAGQDPRLSASSRGRSRPSLRPIPPCRDAAVVVGQDAAGKRLVACVVVNPVVLDSGAKIQNPKSDLRAWLAERLPRAHGAGGGPRPRCPAAHGQRQGGPPGPRPPGAGAQRIGRLGGAAHARRGGARRPLGRAPRRGPRRRS